MDRFSTSEIFYNLKSNKTVCTTEFGGNLIDAVEGFGYVFTLAGKFVHEICYKICKQATRKQKLLVRNAGLSELKFQLLRS